MKSLTTGYLCFLTCLSMTVACLSQDELPTKPPTGFDWLTQFEGQWNVVSQTPGSNIPASRGTIHSKTMGQQWLINKHQAELGGIAFEAIQTLGYDSEKKEFVGTWIDSLSDFTWQYRGTLDESGKKIVLNARGPDWTDPTKMRDYRDTYKFVSENEIAAESQVKNRGRAVGNVYVQHHHQSRDTRRRGDQ